MTTPPIVSITDELIAELDEQLCGPEFYMVEMPIGHMRALLAERAELKRDAERYRWLRLSAWYVGPEPTGDREGVSWDDHNEARDSLNSAIDAAMQP